MDQCILVAVRVVKAFRYRVYPTPKQIVRIHAWENALRSLWNLANEQRRMGYARPRDERVFPTAFDQINETTELRAEVPWLDDVPRNVCNQLLVKLDEAWQRCFKKIAKAPRWKRKGRDFLSLCEPHPKVWRLDGQTIRFPKLGNLRAVIHRPPEGKPKTCTLKRDGDQWFVSITCELKMDDLAPRVGPVVAIDRGVVNIVGDSDGKLVPSPRYYEKALKRLARAQRTVSRRKKGSKNREKAKIRVMKIHRQVRRQREHFLHTLSYSYAKSHGIVVFEKLNVYGMIRGRCARGIADSGWASFDHMLSYKLLWSGGRTEYVCAAFSSQTCSEIECQHVDANSRVSQSLFRCTKCGHTEHADLNAPKVLKQRFETRASLSGLPGEGACSKEPLRTRKRVGLRVPRRSSRKSSGL